MGARPFIHPSIHGRGCSSWDSLREERKKTSKEEPNPKGKKEEGELTPARIEAKLSLPSLSRALMVNQNGGIISQHPNYLASFTLKWYFEVLPKR